MKYDFDSLMDRSQFYSIKWNAEFSKQVMGFERFDEDTIPLYTADMDFPCAKSVQNALMELAQHNNYGYAYGGGDSRYTRAVRNWLKKHYDWDVQAHEITPVAGTIDGMSKCVQALTKPGDEILIMPPTYGAFKNITNDYHRVEVDCYLVNDGTGYYSVNWEDFEEKTSRETVKIFFLCSPQNPGGRIYTSEELCRMANICRKNKVVIIADEIHGELIRKGQKFIPIAKATGAEGIITCISCNKTFNLAGLQASNLIIQDEKLQAKINSLPAFFPNLASLVATTGAYEGGQEWLDQVNDYIDGNIEWAIGFIKEHLPKVKVRYPEASYMLWLDFSECGLTPEEIHRRIYVEANVLLEDGVLFDAEHCQMFQRVAICSPRSMVKEALTRIARMFEDVM